MSSAWSAFVKGMRAGLVLRKDTLVHAIVGNEAADLDSIVSALVLA